MISGTKIDERFPKRNFLIEGFSAPYRLHRDSTGGGIMLYIRADILSNLPAFKDKPIEGFLIEINKQILINTQILINCSYNPHKSEIKKHLTALGNSLDLHSSKYDKILILGGFHVEIEEANMKFFLKVII